MLALNVAAHPEIAFQLWGKHCIRPHILEALKQKCPRSDFPTASDWGQAVSVEILTGLRRRTCLETEESDVVSVALSARDVMGPDDTFSHELALDERLDAMIDRAIKRLVQIKAVKPIVVPKRTVQSGDQPAKMIARRSVNGS